MAALDNKIYLIKTQKNLMTADSNYNVRILMIKPLGQASIKNLINLGYNTYFSKISKIM